MTPEISISTARLTLRTPILNDFAPVNAYARSPRARFTGGQKSDEMDIWRSFLGVAGHWALRGYGLFTVLKDGTPIGRVGVIDHIMWEEPELGWHLFDGFEGRGYATEAAAAARDWAGETLGLGPLVSYVHPENTASRRVAERLGADYERDTLLLGHSAQVWRHTGGPNP
ncbi:GNAT family N-acetyltransferase [Antarctobacter jejuensis]|uniref:GNAT family N-acetyltransferase n=1 Tax=Antarctobacter jejuensis TaxID=1439938 RepID=UPI003FD200D7